MHTILGANGPIARELAKELHRRGVGPLRLVSRNPRQINGTDETVSADLRDAAQTRRAVAGSSVVYFTAGLPPDTAVWETQFPGMLDNAQEACRAAGARFAYFDNTYMYPQDGRVLTEDTPFAPVGRKGRGRAAMATRVLEEMARGVIPVAIARAPEFYGPGGTQSFTNALIIDKLRSGKTPLVPVRDDVRRTLIWAPDASRALAAIGNTADAFGQTWHLPCCDERLTYAEFVRLACEVFGRPPGYRVVRSWVLQLAGVFSKGARELRELLPRYAHDNLFDSRKFRQRFPEFAVTTYREGLSAIRREATQ